MSLHVSTPPPITIAMDPQALFYEKLKNIEERAHKVGLTMTDICKQSGVARATPDRWRKELPKTIQCLQDMETVVAEAEKRNLQ